MLMLMLTMMVIMVFADFCLISDGLLKFKVEISKKSLFADHHHHHHHHTRNEEKDRVLFVGAKDLHESSKVC